MLFSVGDRVKVSDHYHWARGTLGTVVQPPDAIVEMSGDWHGPYREVASLRGVLIFYWVEFDHPHRDADGDGPYSEAEIDSGYLLPAEGRASSVEGTI
jgi:hypothetical protein